jgi:glycosyltransferase involved in cell wall biosynthesis
MNTKVFIICSGLGNVLRGYESFTRECFDTLKKEPLIDITLFKGGGHPAKKEIVLWNLPQRSWLGARLGQITRTLGQIFKGHSSYNAYYIEQLTFTISLLPYIHQHKPDVIYFSDQSLGDFLGIWRYLTKQQYKLLFCDGAPMSPDSPRCDHIQRLTPIHFQIALNHGVPAEKQTLLPLGANIAPTLEILASPEREELRRKLDLPEARPLVLSVAAINSSHKRMDYLIREMASLPEPRPYLLLLGQQDSESPAIIQLGRELLGDNNFQVKTVPLSDVKSYYLTADCFVLTSLKEGLGRVLIEAMSYGLPCLVHDYPVTQFVLENHGYFADFTKSGSLTDLLSNVLSQGLDSTNFYLRHRSVYERFSWDMLRSKYVQMIQRCVEKAPV